MLEPGEIPGTWNGAVVLAKVEIAGIENVDQEMPHLVGVARVDRGEPVQRIVGKRYSLFCDGIFPAPQ